MINKYGLINHFDKINAYLSVIFDDEIKNITPKQDDDCLIYEKNGKIYRVDIFGVKKYVKIKFKGLVALPNYELISILNGFLGKYSIMLQNKSESGFFIAKDGDTYKVKVKKDTLLADGTFAKEDRYATYRDLDMDEEKNEIIIDEEMNDKDIGKDFFQMEEREL